MKELFNDDKQIKNIITVEKTSIQQPMRLFLSSIYILTALILIGALVLAGCESNAPEAQCPSAELVKPFWNPDSSKDLRTLPSPSRFQLIFTGRDSFGIALDAAVAGDIEEAPIGEDSLLVSFSGTGQSALLGELDVTQIHYVDLSSNEIGNGRFTFKGKSGEIVSGTYEGSRTPAGEGFTIRVKALVTGGYVRCTPTTLETGWGWINGSFTEGELDYQLDGWLFHHAENKE